MPNANISIECGVYSKKVTEEPFRPWETYTAAFTETTDLESYLDFLPDFALSIWDYVEEERAGGAEINVNFRVVLENVTHVPTAKGVVPLAKGHRDSSMTDLEITSQNVIEDYLKKEIADIKQGAKY